MKNGAHNGISRSRRIQKSFFALLGSILGLSLIVPALSWAGSPVEKTDKIQVVLCRFARLTDILVPENILKVAMSNPNDFKLATIRYKSRTHLVLKPLKDKSSSDLIIFGINRVHYLRVKTVEKGKHYETRVEMRDQRPDLRHF